MAKRILHIEPDGFSAQIAKTQIETIPSITYVGSAATGKKGLELIEKLRPELVLIELQLPDLDGLDVVTFTNGLKSDIRIVVFTTRADEVALHRISLSTINGFVWKTNDCASTLLHAISEVAAGRNFIATELFRAQRALASRPDYLFKLFTLRELELIPKLGTGASDEEISRSFNLGAATIHSHRLNIMRKLGLDRKDKLMTWAIQKGFVHTVRPSASNFF